MSGRPYSLAEVESSFFEAMRAAGLLTDARIVADGALHRVHVEGDRLGMRNGWYVLHGDGIPAGAFGTWKGVTGAWRAHLGRKLTTVEADGCRVRINAARAARDAEQVRTHATARVRAAKLWGAAGEAADDHEYLARKGVRAHGLRQANKLLLVPVNDATGELHGLQFIGLEGIKKFLRGTRKGGAFHLIGDCSEGEPLAIAEGYATAATIHEATGWPVAVAFDCGNLEPVAMVLASTHPDRRIVIAADNDRLTPGNPGLTKGRLAAAAVGGLLVYPNFRSADSGSDWNDHSALYGLPATRAALLSVLEVRNAP